MKLKRRVLDSAADEADPIAGITQPRSEISEQINVVSSPDIVPVEERRLFY